MFRFFQIIIREFHRSLLKLLHIHDLVRFYKLLSLQQIPTHDMLPQHIRRTPSQLHSLQQIPTQHDMLPQHIQHTPSQLHSLQQIPAQHDMLPQHLVYKNELNREYVITLARNDETP